MTSGDKPHATSTSLRAMGGIVVLATVLLTILFLMFLKSPLRPVHSRQMEGVFVWGLLACMVLSLGGGLYMFSRTRNRWWFLTIVPFAGVIVVWFLVALMGPVTFH